MSREGSCPCGAVRYSIEGLVRDVIVCHCSACREATGGPWFASATRRQDLVVEDPAALEWTLAAVSEHGASRGSCRACGTTVFWDAPARSTVSFATGTLADAGAGLEVAAHIWVPEEDRGKLLRSGLTVTGAGLPASVSVPWRE